MTRELLFYLGVSCVIGFVVKLIWQRTHGEGRSPASRHGAVLDRLKSSGRLSSANLSFDRYETIIAGELVLPDDIKTTLDDIGGLEEQKRVLAETVILPIRRPELYQGLLRSQPKGILLYGPPGTGKTMLARAIAKESSANFLNLKISTLKDKYFGESEKLVAATFRLARKIAPCIIFIDEIDAFLRQRTMDDHPASATVKAEFLSLWDGFESTDEDQVVVMGASNRPFEIDDAFLRRMPMRIHVALPDVRERESILRVILAPSVEQGLEKLASDVASRTPGFSGSDLRELCRSAAMIPVREAIRSVAVGATKGHESVDMQSAGLQEAVSLRALTAADFENALATVVPNHISASEMKHRLQSNLVPTEKNPSSAPAVSSPEDSDLPIESQASAAVLRALLASLEAGSSICHVPPRP